MSQKTPLYDQHVEAGGKIVDFAGWQMPINYGSQIEEHHQVRNGAGMFDVSHMTIIDVLGADAKAFLQYLLANDVDKLKVSGKALYSGMLSEEAGVIDDLIVYYFTNTNYRMVVNAATRDKDIAWITKVASSFDVEINERPELAMIAVQGPKARKKVLSVVDDVFDDATALITSKLGLFFAHDFGDLFIARTGYTGEDGFEVILPENVVSDFWGKLIEVGVKPIGLGARDSLRLEAGMNLYGSDMDETLSPLQAGMGWTIAWEPESRNFIGREALANEKKEGVKARLVGLVLNDKGIIRSHQKVHTVLGEGEITSGAYSPTIGKSIAFARIPNGVEGSCEVEIRGKKLSASIVKLPFVKNGKVLI